MTGTKWKIVDKDNQLMSYEGKDLIFESHERERAEAIVWLLHREALGGPFTLKPIKSETVASAQ